RTRVAIAGGVNVTIHPNKYLVLSSGQFISSDGHCQSFGEGGDGYIPGEGVGVVVLKRLSDAERDGDHIYAIIRGSALNHGGKTNGYTVPNPNAQAAAITRALADARVDARHVTYIEAHGTGTKLGDPIEIAALNKAFQKHTRETGFCLIGSAKSNIGHCESAAGIAGLTKVLLQMQHRQIVPSLHSAKLNPHIDFPKSPFVVNQTLTPWEPPVIEDRRVPRIAGISSFGAGGSNAHIIVEEYVPPAAVPVALESAVIVLSARTGVQLQQKARDLLKFVRPRLGELDLAALAYTLQTGREAMEERLGFLVRTPDELAAKLESWLEGTQGAEDVFEGQVKRNNDTLSLFLDSDLQQAIDRWIAGRKLSKLLELWVKGLDVDWSRLYDDARPRRMSLPVYPFARERYWVEIESGDSTPAERVAAAVLHPLLHSNISDLSEQRYRTTFTGDEFFLSDHQVAANGQAGQKVLPGVVYLEMARAAIEQALPRRVEGTALELRNTVWAQPVVVDERKDVHIALAASGDERVDYEIYSGEGEEEIVHCQGRAVLSHVPAPERISLEQLRSEMEGQVAPDSVYATLARKGLVYGPAFQTITAIHRGSGQVLAYLRLPAVLAEKAGQYVLHPSLMDGALQAAVALLDGESTQPRLPFALETLRILAPCAPQMTAWVRLAPGSQPADAVVKLDVDLCDASGNVCAQMHGFSTRTLGAELASARAGAAGSLIATPVWHDSAGAAAPWTSEQGEHSVVLCELPQADKLAALLPQSVSLVLKGDPGKTVAQRYSDHALACFERIQAIFQTKPQGRILFQIVIEDTEEKRMLSGLSGLLKTAGLENPRFFGQVIAVPAHMPADELAARLRSEQPQDPLVRYENGVRRIVRWQEVPVDAEKPPVAFREDGVYLIVGGMGGLGTLFAREIFEQTGEARVVLTGRSPFDGELKARLETLSETGRIDYRQLDLSDADQVARVIAGIHSDYGRLDGILHSAGMIADSFILKKDKSHFSQVLEPKVTGTWNLDQASKDLALDFFVLFSSVSGATGNLGQADYAAANAFMDAFAWYRNRLVAAGLRRGRTRSINWPLWHAGGMTVDAERQELMLQVTGMQPMRTATGLEAFHRSLALPHDQTLVVAGNLAQLRRTLLAGPSLPVEEEPPAPAVLEGPGLTERAREFLRKELASVLKLPPGRIDPQAALEEYGIDSILAMKLTSQLEKTFGSLPKTLFFEYQTIDQLVSYFTAQHAAPLTALLAPAAEKPSGPAPSQALVPAPAKLASSRRAGRLRGAAQASSVSEDPIAIIGLSGRYPEAPDIEAYWDNLRNGRDCITEVPKERWDWREYFSENRGEQGHHYSKWGGFISGVDEFDPLFFNISPVDAEMIDPQERLFLQHVWAAVEDAGYTRAALQAPAAGDLPGQVGVYVGVMYSEYQMFGAEAGARGKRLPVPGSTASIANRVSYVLNLHGPSVTLDTMCSSSLTAIHFACQDLKLGRTSMAIAGGVNVTIHPNKYLVLSAGQFISSAGHCQSFGEGGDGYIPGEGVGVVVLKRLSEAKRDGDHIYGIIRASALNHGGKTNGYTVPNPQAQASVVARALAESKIDPRHISYIEAHGTGTTLGDPIEIAALSKAFRQYTQDTQYCLIGSAKSNIGHCESAAGIAGVTKVLLQMQHQEIVPSLHSAQLNPHIDFSSSPFIVNQTLRPWEPPVIDGRSLPRIAGVSSFGAGGSNAHLLIEEYRPPAQQPMLLSSFVIVLSARTAEQLQQRAADLLAFIRRGGEAIDPASLAWTLQCGREAMEHRLGFVVKSMGDLAGKLESFVSGERMIEDAYFGEVTRNNEALSLFSTDADLKQTVDKWIAGRRLAKLLDLWVKGLDLDWGKLYGEIRPARMSLPTYPFARERYWVDAGAGVQVSMAGSLPAAVLHPLLHSNTSDLNEQRYRSFFQGDEFFLADHQVKLDGRGSDRILPGVAYLEMARAALEQAVPERPASSSLELRNVVWAQPIIVSAPRQISIALSPAGDDQIDYEIYSQDGEQEIVHGQGCAVFTVEPAPARLDPAALEARMANGRVEPGIVYGTLSRMGLHYGPAFQGIVEILRGAGQVLARLRLPKTVEPASADYVLHPSMMDSALQATVGLIDDLSSPASEPRLPFALDSLRIVAPCTPSMFAWIRHAAGSQPADRVVKLDIDLCDEDGNVCVQMRGLLSRVVSREARAIAGSDASAGSLLAVPVWQASAIESFTPLEFTERHVVLCELPSVELDALGSLLPLSECL
ncbi:MAG TPA: SDR family NAD(P)-dependent oxidoreductase, partial [Thermoanaerobaculia bacterium]|nr:SDR family NAD(P)-dependent oxidoreductase [Thermoanaerobaculia bacterium]